MKKSFDLTINEGDACIRIKSDKTVQLVFAEDEETVIREPEWDQQEVYKTAVQFALMIDTFFKNGEGLDNLILHSPSGSVAAELLGKDLLAISLAGMEDTGEQEGKDIYSGKTLDNVVDASKRFIMKEDNDETE